METQHRASQAYLRAVITYLTIYGQVTYLSSSMKKILAFLVGDL